MTLTPNSQRTTTNPNVPRRNTVLVLSGGLDSLVLAHWTKVNFPSANLLALCFDYGQRAAVERKYARNFCKALGIPFEVVDVSKMRGVFGSSSLTSANPQLSGKSTVVPNRNAIFLNIAAAACDAMGGGVVLYGAHKSTAGIYPDTTPQFVNKASEAILEGTGGKVWVAAPFIEHTKAGVVDIGAELEVPFNDSWSCYANGSHHCGECYACKDRRSAFEQAGVRDPTIYYGDYIGITWYFHWLFGGRL
jgi:7-cyano-7-deazaguanine synthase